MVKSCKTKATKNPDAISNMLSTEGHSYCLKIFKFLYAKVLYSALIHKQSMPYLLEFRLFKFDILQLRVGVWLSILFLTMLNCFT